jgi:hypothetical protein
MFTDWQIALSVCICGCFCVQKASSVRHDVDGRHTDRSRIPAFEAPYALRCAEAASVDQTCGRGVPFYFRQAMRASSPPVPATWGRKMYRRRPIPQRRQRACLRHMTHPPALANPVKQINPCGADSSQRIGELSKRHRLPRV